MIIYLLAAAVKSGSPAGPIPPADGSAFPGDAADHSLTAAAALRLFRRSPG